MARIRLMGLAALIGLIATMAQAKILPDNNLYLEDNRKGLVGGITQEEFNAVIERANRIYKPIVQNLGGSLTISPKWDDSTVNASATQMFGLWIVNMYGGLARRPEVTIDGFALVLCHEIGHHLAGFPFSSMWAANEGQSDYFATHQCAPMIWKDDIEGNRAARAIVPAIAKEKCDAVYLTEDAQNLCYRTVLGGKSLADLLAVLKNQTIDFATPDTTEVTATNNNHPQAQCRLDTYTAGSLCTATFDSGVIPGKNSSDRNGRAAEEESARYNCTASGQYTAGLRPRCWFKPNL